MLTDAGVASERMPYSFKTMHGVCVCVCVEKGDRETERQRESVRDRNRARESLLMYADVMLSVRQHTSAYVSIR